MLAIAAAIVFAIALLSDLLKSDFGAPQLFNHWTLSLIGFLLLSLHLAGFGSRGRWHRGRR